MALSPHKRALRGTLSGDEELGKTPGGVEAKIHDPEESNCARMAGRDKASGAAGKYQLRRAAAEGNEQERQCLRTHACPYSC